MNITNIANIACKFTQTALACEVFTEGVIIGTVTGSFKDSFSVTPGATVTLVNLAVVYQADPDEHVVWGDEDNG